MHFLTTCSNIDEEGLCDNDTGLTKTPEDTDAANGGEPSKVTVSEVIQVNLILWSFSPNCLPPICVFIFSHIYPFDSLLTKERPLFSGINGRSCKLF